jgi:hypothetical protein
MTSISPCLWSDGQAEVDRLWDALDGMERFGIEKAMIGCFHLGSSSERIFGDIPKRPFEDAVWPTSMRENAVRVFKL